jgi:hypothetical protein
MPRIVNQMKSSAADAPTSIASASPSVAAIPNPDKAVKILSKSIYREMRRNGCEPKEIVALATELISLVTTEINDARLA